MISGMVEPDVRGLPGEMPPAPPARGRPACRLTPGRCSPRVASHEQPVVVPQVMHLRQVPLRTIVNWPQSPHGSPS